MCYVFLGYPTGATETVTNTLAVGSVCYADNFTLRIPLLNISETLSDDPIGDALAFALNGDETDTLLGGAEENTDMLLGGDEENIDMLLKGDEKNTSSACVQDCPSGRSGERDTCPERSEQNTGTRSVGDSGRSGERDTSPERSEQNTEDDPPRGARDELCLDDMESSDSDSEGSDSGGV